MKILLGITGSVATVLTPKLSAALLAAEHDIKIVATDPALYFLKTPPFYPEELILKCSNQDIDVFIDKSEWPSGGYHKNDPVRHIEFRDWADVLLIAPLSANTLAKIACGLADNFLSCIARAWPKEKPLIIAPAMNTEMWIDPITAQQIQALDGRFRIMRVVDPISKQLACGDVGKGAMADIDTIIQVIQTL